MPATRQEDDEDPEEDDEGDDLPDDSPVNEEADEDVDNHNRFNSYKRQPKVAWGFTTQHWLPLFF